MTSTGVTAEEGRTIAVDPDVVPYGSVVEIHYPDGRIHQYVAEDCGGAIKQNKIDVFMNDHDAAKQAGVVKEAKVYLVAEKES